MIDIYDEVGYIGNVLQNGFSSKWQRDATLLIRYFKSIGLDKQEIKEKIKEKCQMAADRGIIYYNPLVDYSAINRILDKAWRNTSSLRQIRQIVISREELNFFLNLEETLILTDEQVRAIKCRRQGIKISKNHALNWQRVEYLFTLFIWTRIQEFYLDVPNVHYLNNYQKRFKEDANLKPSFNLQKERDYMYDLGLIDVNYALGIKPTFMEKYPFTLKEFEIPEDEKITITTGEPPTGDLYNPGKWLTAQKYGTFTCELCGKTLPRYGGRPQDYKRKYCKECVNKQKNKTKQKENYAGENLRWCEDCGDLFQIMNKYNYSSRRCPQCQEARDAELHVAREQAYRDRLKKGDQCLDTITAQLYNDMEDNNE